MEEKFCGECSSTKATYLFSKDSARKDGLQSSCKDCAKAYRLKNRDRLVGLTREWREANKEYSDLFRLAKKEHGSIKQHWFKQIVINRKPPNRAEDAFRCAKRKATKIRATVLWADKVSILSFYQLARRLTLETGVKHVVDHIVPLQSKIVCGLHCEANLRVITDIENKKKSNRRWPDMP